MNLLDFLYALAAALTAPWWARKPRSGWRERLGHTPKLAPKGNKPRLMIHAVSVGEVSALRSLVPLLVDDVEVVISVGTDTGIARARALFAQSCTIVRYPLDFTRCVMRFLDAVKPDAVALVELEVWPNFIKASRKRSIPVVVINGRLSENSFRGYRRLRLFLRKTFASLSLVCAQDETYRSRFIDMGVATDRCVATGSMKWDAIDLAQARCGPSEQAINIASALGIDRAQLLVVAGSTAEGEEDLMHRACPAGVQLVCAPRRPERFDEAAAAMPGCVRRSLPGSGNAATGRFLLDTIGELGAVYQLADLVVIGRTFAPLGGSDPTEPMALGKPVIIGPHVEHFASIVESLEHAHAVIRADEAGLAGVVRRLIDDADERSDLAARGLECVRQEQGASMRHAELLILFAKRVRA